MLCALLVALCWSIASVAAARAAAHADGVPVSRARLALALAALGTLAWWQGDLRWHSGGWWFVASGALGLALGDTALFAAYERLGARLPALIAYALAVPLAAAVEWAWLGTTISALDAALVATLLIGVALALAAPPEARAHSRGVGAGAALALLAAAGFALSAVCIREGYRHWTPASGGIPGVDLAFLRCCGGAAVSLALWPFLRGQDSLGYWTRRFERRQGRRSWMRALPWLVLAALAGPIVGVLLYQLALTRTPSALVQAVVALVPVAVIPLAWMIEGDRPSPRALAGALLAGVAAVALALVHLR